MLHTDNIYSPVESYPTVWLLILWYGLLILWIINITVINIFLVIWGSIINCVCICVQYVACPSDACFKFRQFDLNWMQRREDERKIDIYTCIINGKSWVYKELNNGAMEHPHNASYTSKVSRNIAKWCNRFIFLG